MRWQEACSDDEREKVFVYQNDMILQYMKEHGGISTYDAFQMGITRLAARISELRHKQGLSIISERKLSENKKPYVLYRLEDES